MRTWILLFFSAFTLGFCLSYLATNPAIQSPVALHLNITTNDPDGAKVLVDTDRGGGLSKRHTSFNRGEAGSRESGVLPKAYAGGREVPTARRAIPMIPGRGPAQRPAAGNPARNRGELAGKLLDAARHELDGRTAQRDLILASIFEEVIRTRISESTGPDTKTPAPQPLRANTPAERPLPPDNPPSSAPVEEKQTARRDRLPAAAVNPPSPPEEISHAATAAATAPAPLPVAPQEVEPPAAQKGNTPDFRLVNVTFVKNLRGLRDFDPCPNIFNRGEKVQFKAEFEGLREEPSGTEKDRTYTRRFSANWKLMDTRSEIIDSRTFIEPRSIVYRPGERNNILMVFDTCELPNNLTPGDYRILVQGKDLFAKKETAAVLDLQVRKTSSLFSPGPAKLDTSDLEVVPPYVEPPANSEEDRKTTVDPP